MDVDDKKLKRNLEDDISLSDNTTALTDSTIDKTHYSLRLDKERSVEFQYTEDFSILNHQNIKSIEDWQFGEKMGKGSFCTIKIIRNSITGEEQALKIYNKETQTKGYFEEKKPLDKVFKEIRYWSEFSNEHIPKLYEHFNDSNYNKMYVRSQLGDLGCPGYWSGNYTKHTLKERVYDQFLEKITKEKKRFLRRLKSSENSPEMKKESHNISDPKQKSKSDEAVNRKFSSMAEISASPIKDIPQNSFKKTPQLELVIGNKNVPNIDSGSPLIKIEGSTFIKPAQIIESPLIVHTSPERKELDQKLFNFEMKRMESFETKEEIINLTENVDKNASSIQLQKSDADSNANEVQILNSSIDVNLFNNNMENLQQEKISFEKNINKSYVDLVRIQTPALNKTNFSPMRDQISHKIFVDMVKQFSPNIDQFTKLNKSDIVDSEFSNKKQKSPTKHAVVYGESMSYQNAIQDFLSNIPKDFQKNNPDVCENLSIMPIKELCKIDVFSQKFDCLGLEVDYAEMNSEDQKQYVIGRIFFDICIGIQYLHHIGITHRDIKNDNVVIQSKEHGGPKAMVIDFNSISYWEEIGVNIRDTTGLTKAYAAPEVFDANIAKKTITTLEEQQEYLDQNESVYEDKCEDESDIEFKLRKLAEFGHFQRMKCDIYSLGIVQYVMYFGKFPYATIDDKLIENEVMELDVDKATETAPEPIKSQMRGLLQKDPEKRHNWDEEIWYCKLFEKLHKKIIIRDE